MNAADDARTERLLARLATADANAITDEDRAVIQAAKSMATQHKQNRPRTSGPCVCLVCEAVHAAKATT